MDLFRISSNVSCPIATRDQEVNDENRQTAVSEAFYGPLDPDDESYWVKLSDLLNMSVEESKNSRCGNCGVFDVTKSMLNCIGDSNSDLGYCRIFQFTCSAKRTCTSWVPDGPITDK